jgi:hypothetical protein
MKKRILMILMVLVLASSFIYAENNVLFATVSPFALQKVETSWDTSYNSDYGWGARAGYRRFVGPLLIGADLGYQGFKQPTTEYVLTSVQLLAKVGGKVVLADNCDLNAEIGGGVEMAVSRHVINFLPVVAGSVSLSSYVKPNMAMVVGADVSVSWPKTKDSSYKATVWQSDFNIGLEYDF